MKILALDLATNTGYARNYGAEPRTGSVSFERKKATTKREADPIGFTYSSFYRWLSDHEGELKPDVLAVEEPIGGGGFMAKLKSCIGLWAIANEWAFNNGIPVVSIKNRDMKASFVGLANAEKADIVKMAERRGYKINYTEVHRKDGTVELVGDDDQADACLLLEYMKELKGVK